MFMRITKKYNKVTPKNDLGKLLYNYRKENHMSREKLAKRIGCSSMEIQRWESGTVTKLKPKSIQKIKKFFSSINTNNNSTTKKIINHNNNLNTILRDNLKELIYNYRKENYMSMEELAKRIGCSSMEIQRWEHGIITKLQMQSIQKINNFFGDKSPFRFAFLDNYSVAKKNINSKINLGKLLYNYRKENHMSREKLAKKIGCSSMEIQRWEHGIITKPQMKSIQKINKFFGDKSPFRFVASNNFINTKNRINYRKNINPKTNLGRLLYNYRIENNISRKELAKRIGCSIMEIQRWESGIVTKLWMRSIQKINKFFGDKSPFRFAVLDNFINTRKAII